jgi:hypothetical protein
LFLIPTRTATKDKREQESKYIKYSSPDFYFTLIQFRLHLTLTLAFVLTLAFISNAAGGELHLRPGGAHAHAASASLTRPRCADTCKSFCCRWCSFGSKRSSCCSWAAQMAALLSARLPRRRRAHCSPEEALLRHGLRAAADPDPVGAVLVPALLRYLRRSPQANAALFRPEVARRFDEVLTTEHVRNLWLEKVESLLPPNHGSSCQPSYQPSAQPSGLSSGQHSTQLSDQPSRA